MNPMAGVPVVPQPIMAAFVSGHVSLSAKTLPERVNVALKVDDVPSASTVAPVTVPVGYAAVPPVEVKVSVVATG